jgi:hypothetical protein
MIKFKEGFLTVRVLLPVYNFGFQGLSALCFSCSVAVAHIVVAIYMINEIEGLEKYIRVCVLSMVLSNGKEAITQHITVTIGVRVGMWTMVLFTATLILPLQGPQRAALSIHLIYTEDGDCSVG